jgi:hypothetical protein
MEKLSNSKALSKGAWMIRWRPWLSFVFLLIAAIYAGYKEFLDINILLVVMGSLALILMLMTMRAIPNWKKNVLLNAENPKLVLEKARNTFLKRPIVEKSALWKLGELKEFRTEYDLQIQKVREQMLAKAGEIYESKSGISVHQSLGSSLIITLVMTFLILLSILWFRFTEDVTQKTIASGILLIAIVFLVISVKSFFKRNASVLIINKTGITIEKQNYGWDQIAYIDVEAGDALVYQIHRQEKNSFSVVDLSRTPEEIDQAVTHFYNQAQKGLNKNV